MSQVLYIAMYDCERFPGYPFLRSDGSGDGGCTDRHAFGWLILPAFFFVVIFGGYVLPTVLIGIVSISFDEASNRANELQAMLSGMNQVRSTVYTHEERSESIKHQESTHQHYYSACISD